MKLNTVSKMNLIDPNIIYGAININKDKKTNIDIHNFNMIEAPKKGYINYPMFSFPENFDIKNINLKLENSTLIKETTTLFFNQLNKDGKTEPEEVFKDDNKIIYDKIINDNKKEDKEFLNKKRKTNNKDEHYNKFSSDSIVKKIRILILNSIFKFINEKIKILFNNDIGKGIFRKILLPINKSNLFHSSVEYDKEFLNKKLKEIFSSISDKFTNYLNTKNKDLIEYLINLENKGKYFQELFELSFLDCLEHIRGTKNSEILNDLPKINDILIQEGKNINEDEIEIYKEIINNYETIIAHKKKRNAKKIKKRKKSENSKNSFFIVNYLD